MVLWVTSRRRDGRLRHLPHLDVASRQQPAPSACGARRRRDRHAQAQVRAAMLGVEQPIQSIGRVPAVGAEAGGRARRAAIRRQRRANPLGRRPPRRRLPRAAPPGMWWSRPGMRAGMAAHARVQMARSTGRATTKTAAAASRAWAALPPEAQQLGRLDANWGLRAALRPNSVGSGRGNRRSRRA